MEEIVLELPVVGVKFLPSLEGFDDVERYSGVSYCDAVRLAQFGVAQVVVPGSIDTCRWAPVVLGFKEPESEFESGLEPRLTDAPSGVYLAPLFRFGDGMEPDIVIVRGRPDQLRSLTDALPPGSLVEKYRGQIGRTALGTGDGGLSLKVLLSIVSNRIVALMRNSRRFDELTKTLFKRESVSNAFEKLAKNAVADMSMCRNSSVLPYLEDVANVSFFCVGGITWGRNSPTNMTCGMPYRLYRGIEKGLKFPGQP